MKRLLLFILLGQLVAHAGEVGFPIDLNSIPLQTEQERKEIDTWLKRFESTVTIKEITPIKIGFEMQSSIFFCVLSNSILTPKSTLSDLDYWLKATDIQVDRKYPDGQEFKDMTAIDLALVGALHHGAIKAFEMVLNRATDISKITHCGEDLIRVVNTYRRFPQFFGLDKKASENARDVLRVILAHPTYTSKLP